MTKHENTESAYTSFNKRMGLSGSESTHDLQQIAGKPSLFSSGATSDVKPTMIPVKSIDNFEELTKRTKFPDRGIKDVAYFASPENFIIDQVVTVDVTEHEVVWNYDTITFKKGGSINVNGSFDFTINCVSIFKE